jgi:hypothetical protein
MNVLLVCESGKPHESLARVCCDVTQPFRQDRVHVAIHCLSGNMGVIHLAPPGLHFICREDRTCLNALAFKMIMYFLTFA